MQGMYLIEPQHCKTLFESVGEFYDYSSSADIALALWLSPDGVNGMCASIATHKGPPDDGKKALQKLREATPIAMDMMAAVPLLDFIHGQDEGFCNVPGNYWTSIPFTKKAMFSEKAYEWIESVNATRPGGGIIVLEPWFGADKAGRAVTKKGGREDATAFGARSVEFTVMLIAMFDPSSKEARDEAVSWVKAGKAAAEKIRMTTKEAQEYSGYTSAEDGITPISSSARLRKIKTKWDPDNLFARNQLNILPEGVDASATAEF